jgi:hypothetical protein
MNDTVINTMNELKTKLDRMERRLWLQEKAAYTQEEIVEAMGLKGQQRALLDYMKSTGILHSPITKRPLIYPGEVVRKAIAKVSKGKVQVAM